MPGAAGGGKKSLEEMFGEMLREIAVLVVVFVPLDALLAPEKIPEDFTPLMVTVILATVVLGILLERLRD